jgi:leader peptidase (prepilin peptidase)/N-methyltransferase
VIATTPTPARTRHGTSVVAGLLLAGAMVALAGVNALPVVIAAPGLVRIASTDAAYHRIPNRLLVTTAAAVAASMTAVLVWAGDWSPVPTVAAATASAAASFLITFVADRRLGPGDLKLAPLVGLVAAWPHAAEGLDPTGGALIGLGTVGCGLGAALLCTFGRRGPAPLAPGLVAASLAVALTGAL